jgi:hypothetical protein
MNTISAGHSQAVFHRQSVTSPVTPTPVQNGQQANPAHAARAALVDRPDLANKPFGSLVSLLARGLPLPPMENAEDTNSTAEEVTADNSNAPVPEAG